MTTRTPTRNNTGGRLAREWARLRTRPRNLTIASRWALLDEPVTDLDEVLEAVGYESERTRSSEQNLRQLVIIAASDDLAARVVIQRILPGLLAVVRRRSSISEHALDELLATAWIAIRTYNPARNPASVAAALISDADYRAFRGPFRLKSATEHAFDPSSIEVRDDRSESSCEQVAELLAEASHAGVPEDDLTLIRDLLDAPTVIELARRLDVTPRTIRNRRDRVTSRLREVALAA